MAGKKSPASLERKKLREKRARASALAAQSSVKADKKKELEEAEYYRKDYAVGCGTNRTYPTYNYDLQFQDGYEITLTDLYANCTGWGQFDTLSKLASPALQDGSLPSGAASGGEKKKEIFSEMSRVNAKKI